MWAFVQSKWWAALPTTLLLSAGLPPQRIGFGPKTRPTTASRRSRCWNSPHWPPTKPTRMIPLTPQCSGPMPRARCEWRGERGERTGMGRRLAAYLRKRRACVAGATQLDIYIYIYINTCLPRACFDGKGGWLVVQYRGHSGSRYLPSSSLLWEVGHSAGCGWLFHVMFFRRIPEDSKPGLFSGSA